MSKRVNELTQEEIAKMFPVELSSYDAQWPELFVREQKLIAATLGNIIICIEHFGSTSIPNLTAKNTIDILVEIADDETVHESIIEKMKVISYDHFWQGHEEQPYMLFGKGYHTTGEKEQTYHVHMGPRNNRVWDRIYFRDYLREHENVAKEYEKLKLGLAVTHKYDRVGYRIAKTEFVAKITALAKQHYLKK